MTASRCDFVLLHGFACTARMWEGVQEHLRASGRTAAALDLPGHGARARCEGGVTFAACVAEVLAAAPRRFALAGYSLGARIALQIALAAPERVAALALISGSPGIADPEERGARLAADLALATQIETEGIERFAARWEQLELFAADPPALRARVLADQRRNTATGLAAALRGLSVGAMEPLWGRLGELAMPCAILAGERDQRYVAIARRMAAAIAGADLEILPGGHRLAHERPHAVAMALEALL